MEEPIRVMLKRKTFSPIVSSALGPCMDKGSTQHSSRAHGEILITSGGSTPMLRQSTRATAGGLETLFLPTFGC